MIGTDSRFRRKDRVLTQRAAGKWILLNLDDGQYYALDEISGRIWELCDGSRSVASMVTAICEDFEASPDTVEADVLSFLDELVNEELVLAEA
jgi:Coenzyme PQQ synthesis protein D (PqqD)